MNSSFLQFSHPSFSGRIGVASEDISPPVGIYARNWGVAAQDTATGIHRPLSCKVLTLQSGKDDAPLILASLDACWWKTREDEWFVRSGLLEEFGLNEERVLVNISHTHAGPSLCRDDADKPGGEWIAPYLETMRAALISAARAALQSARSGVLQWATGSCELAQNRDLPDPENNRVVCGFHPNAVVDNTLLVGRACDESGKIFAVVTNYACHPTTLAWQNTLISPDWVGAFHELIEDQTGATSLFLQGASGELQPRETYTGDVEIADKQGRQLGFAVLSTLDGMLAPRTRLEYSGVVESGAPLATWKRTKFSPNTTLSARQITANLDLIDLPSIQEIERQMLECEDRTLRERLQRKKRVRATIGAGKTAALPVWIWQVGDAILVAQREEAYSQFQTKLRNAFPDKTIIVMNLTNGSCGYLPPAELYDLDIYQVWQTPYARGGLEKLTRAATHAIHEIIEARKDGA